MHWISPEAAVDAEVRLYEHLITAYNPNEAKDIQDVLNPASLQVLHNCKVSKAALAGLKGTKSL